MTTLQKPSPLNDAIDQAALDVCGGRSIPRADLIERVKTHVRNSGKLPKKIGAIELHLRVADRILHHPGLDVRRNQSGATMVRAKKMSAKPE